MRLIPHLDTILAVWLAFAVITLLVAVLEFKAAVDRYLTWRRDGPFTAQRTAVAHIDMRRISALALLPAMAVAKASIMLAGEVALTFDVSGVTFVALDFGTVLIPLLVLAMNRRERRHVIGE